MPIRRFAWYGVPLITLAVVGVALVEPERRLAQPNVAAVVEMRVVPRFAPTLDSVRSQVLGGAALESVWPRMRLAEGAAPSAAELIDRDAELATWRTHLDVETDNHFDDDRRRIVVRWIGAAATAEAATIVESLAMRYAGEISAEQADDQIEKVRRADANVASAARELLQLGDEERSAANSKREPWYTTVVVAGEQDIEGAAPEPLLIDPHAGVSTTESAARETVAVAAVDPVRRAEVVRQMERSLVQLRAAVDGLPLAKHAEFPVVATNVEGLHLAHRRSVWYAGSTAVAAAVALLLTVLTEKRNRNWRISDDAESTTEAADQTMTITAPFAVEPAYLCSADEIERAVKAPVLTVVRRDGLSDAASIVRRSI